MWGQWSSRCRRAVSLGDRCRKNACRHRSGRFGSGSAVNPWSLLERAFGWGGVIAYHGVGDLPPAPVMHISPDRLRSQLEVLGEQHQIVRLRELVDRWRSGVSTRNRVAITFDDAYSGVL